ncbi:uncharacterized protein LOC110739561 [Chenopodium quinoa]|uniref:uncharacterized protein LOC110739561 n=1 Tax=Chenopodium quinoa TaxID=63459 RepID=UPI000B782AFC|nr:uncharacterized protein LOC110739561 [Chenopodium quinoa]
MSVSDKKFNEMMTHNKMLENQIPNLASALKDNTSPSSLPSQGLDPKEPVYYITTRSGIVLEDRVSKRSQEKEKVSDLFDDEEHNVSSKKGESSNEKANKKDRMQDEVIKPKLPYPQKFTRHKLDEQFGKFIEMLKQIHLSIPFTDVLQQMPNYSKFLKEILSGKRECNVVDSVSVGECCSALIYNDLPPKMKDPVNFSIPCNTNGKLFQNALCDLGASVSIMPCSVVKKLKLEIAKDDNIPIILGRPFLATSGALIDVKGSIITLFVSSTNDMLVACDDTPKCVESKIFSEEDKESSKLENEFKMPS